LKSFVKYLIVAALAVVLIAVAVMIAQRYFFKLSDHVEVNDGVALTKEFSIKSPTENQNSSVKGTIIVWGDKGIAKRMRIVASYEIDPDDFSGMTVYIPKKWYISNILSSTPEGPKPPLLPLSSDQDHDFYEWRNMVEVGVGFEGKPSGGGTGTIMIDLVSDQRAIQPSETFNIAVAIGSSMKNGVRTINAGNITIPISVKK